MGSKTLQKDLTTQLIVQYSEFTNELRTRFTIKTMLNRLWDNRVALVKMHTVYCIGSPIIFCEVNVSSMRFEKERRVMARTMWIRTFGVGGGCVRNRKDRSTVWL